MIIDASALVAALTDEPDADRYLRALIEPSAGSRVGAPTLLEAAIVLDRRTSVAPDRLDRLVESAGVEVVSFTQAHGRLARSAYARFGRGSGSPAQLNFGDCLSYALAVAEDEPLLFKGEDFRHTDVRDALAEPDA